MAKLVFGMSQSLDGYVGDAAGTLCMPPPSPVLFRHFIDVVAGHAGCIYGRRIYELMRYWDVDQPEWDVAKRELAVAWRRQPKWVASRTLASVGPNATLIRGGVLAFVRNLRDTVDGELDVARPELAAVVAPLIDEYRSHWRRRGPRDLRPRRRSCSGKSADASPELAPRARTRELSTRPTLRQC